MMKRWEAHQVLCIKGAEVLSPVEFADDGGDLHEIGAGTSDEKEFPCCSPLATVVGGLFCVHFFHLNPST
jgi:hypothetical protein